MSTVQKIKSLVFLVCFVVSAIVYNSISNEKEKEETIQAAKIDKKTSKNSLATEKSSVTTIHYE